MGTSRDSISTKSAIIHAAGELFASHGFAGVTARQVAQAVNVALSTIPYHFGSMENLYKETLLRACEVSPQAQPLAQQALDASPTDGLRLAIRWAIEDYAGINVAWTIRLIAREELDPSPAFQEVIDRKLAPEWNWLSQVVARAAGLDASAPAVKFGVVTMYTLAISTLTHRAVLEKLAPEILQTNRDAFIQTIAQLTLDAVAHYQTNTPAPAASPRP